jgi:hypothetical protein
MVKLKINLTKEQEKTIKRTKIKLKKNNISQIKIEI